MNKLVSVIIPTYNTAAYISEAIDSVLRQTYDTIEIVVIDDGSTDNTKQVLESYIQKGQILYLFQENAGPAAARNRGMKISQGEYIAFLDADDVWESQKLEKQLPLFVGEVSLVYSDMKFFGTPFVFDIYSQMVGKFFKGRVARELLKKNFIPQSSVVFKASIVKEVGYYNEEKALHAVEDYEYLLRISLAHTVDYVAETLVMYRIHGEQISSRRRVGYGRLCSLYAHVFTLRQFRAYRGLIIRKYIENKLKFLIF